MSGDKAPEVLDQLERLVRAGWHMALAGSPGDLSLYRTWITPNSVITDTIGISHAGVNAIRKVNGSERIWSQNGTLATVVDAVLVLPTPDGHTLRDAIDVEWNTRTARVEVFFHLRGGWQCLGALEDDDHLLYLYRRGLGSDESERARLDQREQLGLTALACEVKLGLHMALKPWQVENGCPNHGAGEPEQIRFDDPAMPEIIGRYESLAQNVNLPDLAHCLVFGLCSLRDRSSSRDRDKVAEALRDLRADGWLVQEVAEQQHIANRRWPDGTGDLLMITSRFRAYGLRVDAGSWVVWKSVGPVERITSTLRQLSPPKRPGAPTERLFRMSPTDRSLCLPEEDVGTHGR